jgi:hypothetical protein
MEDNAGFSAVDADVDGSGSAFLLNNDPILFPVVARPPATLDAAPETAPATRLKKDLIPDGPAEAEGADTGAGVDADADADGPLLNIDTTPENPEPIPDPIPARPEPIDDRTPR